MLVNRSEFLDALQKVAPVINSGLNHNHSDYVHFYNGDMIGYDSSFAHLVLLPFPLDGISGSVHFKELVNVLKKMSTTEIDISLEDGHFLIKAGKSSCGLCVTDYEGWMPNDLFNPCKSAEMQPVYPSFFDALKRASFCAEGPDDFSAMTNIQVKDGDVRALNGVQAIIVDLPSNEPAPNCYFPAVSVPYLSSYNFTKMGITQSYFVFMDDSGLMFCVRRNTYEDFPDFSIFLEKAVSGVPFELPSEIGEVIKKAIIFLDKGKFSDGSKITQSILITLKPKRITCKGTGEYGWYEESVKVDYSGDELRFYVAPDNMLAMLSSIHETKYNKEAEMLYNAGSDFKYIFMCCRNPE